MTTLPVIPALRHILQSTLRNLPFAFHVSWPWMAIMFPLQAAVTLYVTANFPSLDPNNIDPKTAMQLLSVQVPAGIMSLIATSSVAVSWHRYILLDEVPVGWQRLRLDGPVLRYFGNAILLSVIIVALALIPALAIGLIGTATGGVATIALMPLLLALLVVIGLRLSVKFPAVALEHKEFGFKSAWQATNSNTLPFFLLILTLVAVGVIVALVATVISLPFGWIQSDFSAMAILAIQFVVNWVMMIFSVTVLTTLYGYFVEKRSL